MEEGLPRLDQKYEVLGASAWAEHMVSSSTLSHCALADHNT